MPLNADPQNTPLIEDELDLLTALVPLAGQDIIELACGAEAVAWQLLRRQD